MATSFDQAFGLPDPAAFGAYQPASVDDYGNLVSQPQQNIMQALNLPGQAPQPVQQMPDFSGTSNFGSPQNPGMPDFNNQSQPQTDANGNPIPQPAQPQQNAMQGAAPQTDASGNPIPQSGQPGQPQPGQPQPGQPPASGPQQLGQIQPLNATSAAPRQKMSLMEVIGKLGNAMTNASINPHPQYLTPLQQAQQQQLAQQKVNAGALDNQAKQQDIAQTGVATAQNANQVVGGFARGLQSLQKAGSNLDIAAPALAQQMGIPQQQAAAILAQAKSDPNFLGTLADAADAQKAGGAGKYANQVTWMRDAQGNLHAFQTSSAGGMQDATPTGYTPLIGDLKYADQGGQLTPYNSKTGPTGGPALPVSGKPQPGTNSQGVPLPGSPAAATMANTQANTARTNAQTTKLTNPSSNTNPAESLGLLNNIQASFDKLHAMDALAGDSTNPASAVLNSVGRTGIGNAVEGTFGGQAAQERLVAQKNVNLLQQQLIKSLPASATRSRFEQEILKASLPDPMNMSYSTANNVINQYRSIYARAVAAANASPASQQTTRPTLTPTYKTVNW